MEKLEKEVEAWYGHETLRVFDVPPEDKDFLASVINSGTASHDDLEQLIHQSLVGGSEDWNNLIECAKSIRDVQVVDQDQLDGHDVLQYVWQMFRGPRGYDKDVPSEPWHETDRLICLAQQLEADQSIIPQLSLPDRDDITEISSPQHLVVPKSPHVHTTPRRRRIAEVSDYWAEEPGSKDVGSAASKVLQERLACRRRMQIPSRQSPPRDAEHAQLLGNGSQGDEEGSSGENDDDGLSAARIPILGPTKGVTSHFFSSPQTALSKPAPRKPPAGTVSCLPFPPLTAPTFGIAQEEFAHEPFWLLVLVTFLIKTKGVAAIPVFRAVKKRFPSPALVADPANADEIAGMIRHLGLCASRLASLQRYARAFLETPPRMGKVFRVRGYDERDHESSTVPRSNSKSPSTDAEDISAAAAATPCSSNPPTPRSEGEDRDDAEAWEIGHMTKGRYALDSWRIFCRDELLGRAEDWNGKGREPEFQPEWMRVAPRDKELRAYLRWMWMREGWEWDPSTGHRTVLRAEMQRAVNEGRVEYDDAGGLRILD